MYIHTINKLRKFIPSVQKVQLFTSSHQSWIYSMFKANLNGDKRKMWKLTSYAGTCTWYNARPVKYGLFFRVLSCTVISHPFQFGVG